MNNNDTFNILHSEFDDCPKMPESLSKRNVVAKLRTLPQERKRTVSFKKLGTIAAAIIVVAVCAVLGTTDFRRDLPLEMQDTASTVPVTQSVLPPSFNNSLTADAKLSQAGSREEIVELFRNSYKENGNIYYLYGMGAVDINGSFVTDDIKGFDTAVPESSIETNTSSSTSDHAQTNVQTQGVDEGDIIKTDSRYIYFVGSDGSGNKKLKIIDTKTMKAVYNSYLYDENGDIIWVSDLYIKDNILVAACAQKNSYVYYGSTAYGYNSGSTVIVSYDITDRANPKLIRLETQDGSYRSSRLIGNVLYTVSQYYVRAENEETLENVCIPKVGGAEITCDCIFLPENMGDSYICMTAMDISDKDGSISALAVLGSTENYYCSQDTFYIVADEYNYKDEYVEVRDKTVINAFSLDGLNISYIATGEVKGSTARSQYALDEYENNLRIATTYYNYKTQRNESSLYVLDENLDIIGKVEDIAKDEQIKSVRYMGDKAYVVTFKNTDPLFAIDLSDPKNPTILGELKLPGYSAYLHPISENRLIGIGYDGNAENADFSTVKVSLFDISDPAQLKELDNVVISDATTTVSYNPKAMLYNSAEGIIGLPVNGNYNTYGDEYSYYLIRVQESGLEIMHKLLHSKGSYVNIESFRGTYIGDKFFTVSDNAVKKFNFTDGKELAVWTNSESVKTETLTTNGYVEVVPTAPNITPATQASTSKGYAVTIPENTTSSGSTGQTTPPYNPNNPAEVTEPALETEMYN